jgi:hypothetical protein
MQTPDPNEGRNDPMVPEYWVQGEALQDRIVAAGYDHPSVDGIAIDLHDILQAADQIRAAIAPEAEADLETTLRHLRFELGHILWHCQAGLAYLEAATAQLDASGQ